MPQPWVILVGHRRGARRAAKALGYRVLVVDDRTLSPAARREVDALVPADLTHGAGPWYSVIDAAISEPPRCVLAGGERGVAFAAELRGHLGLPGLQSHEARAVRDKATMKAVVRAAGVRCADWVELAASTHADDLVNMLGLPLVIKQRAASGSRGTHVVRTGAQLTACLAGISSSERGAWMAEAFQSGTEMSVETLWVDGRAVFWNPTEYLRVGVANIVPAVLSEARREALLDLNARAIAALGIRNGITHLEVYETAETLTFGEVAARAPGGRIMELIERAYGFSIWEALWQIATGVPPVVDTEPRCVAGVWLLHPGAGVVGRMDGLEVARSTPFVDAVRVRVRVGDEVRPRVGTGIDIGAIEASGPSRDVVAEALLRAQEVIRIELD